MPDSHINFYSKVNDYIQKLEVEIAHKSKQIDYILSRCGVNAHGIYIPCGSSKITKDDKAESIKWINKAIDND